MIHYAPGLYSVAFTSLLATAFTSGYEDLKYISVIQISLIYGFKQKLNQYDFTVLKIFIYITILSKNIKGIIN